MKKLLQAIILLFVCLITSCTTDGTSKTYLVVVENGYIVEENVTSKSVTEGDIVTVYPNLSEEEEFTGWYDGGTLLSTDMEYSFVVKNNIDIEARFGESNMIKNGWYVLQYKSESGMEITNNYTMNAILVNNQNAKWYEIDMTGAKETDGTVSKNENSVIITVGLKKYSFDLSSDLQTLSFNNKVNRVDTKMVYQYQSDFKQSTDEGNTSFYSELFGDDINENFYNYCPTIMIENYSTMHIWYCSNKDSGKVTDYIAYRKGTLHDDGKWTFTEKELVLAPTSGAWDSVHVCDPTVVKGSFKYNNEDYNYLLAYLGCATYNCTINEVGIAVAKNPNGPFVKVDNINPIANYNKAIAEHDSSWASTWGYGQPSLINVDKKGRIMLFYSVGTPKSTHTAVEEWNLLDLNNPVKLSEGIVSNMGVTSASGVNDCINNADFAYDPINKRVICVKEDFPYPTDNNMNWVAGTNTLMYMPLDDNEASPMHTLFDNNTKSWICFGVVSKDNTGFERNHNCGLVTDEYGWITSPTKIHIVYTTNRFPGEFPNWSKNGQWPALHTYRLHGLTMDLPL